MRERVCLRERRRVRERERERERETVCLSVSVFSFMVRPRKTKRTVLRGIADLPREATVVTCLALLAGHRINRLIT